MFSVRTLFAALAAVMITTAASAADLPQPPPVYQPIAEPCCAGAWYLRGEIGIGISTRPLLIYEPSAADVGNGFQFQHWSMDDTTFFGVGVGYEFNNWFRADVTAEYRSKAEVRAYGIFPSAVSGDIYTGSIRSVVVLANGYIDLGTWNCLTPFIGAGVGAAFNTLDDFVDTGLGTTGSGSGGNPTETHLAWALHAGISYAVTQNFTVELAYRYLNYGSITDTVNCIGGCHPDSYKFNDLTSNDIMLGMRWRFPPTGFVAPAPPAAISTRG